MADPRIERYLAILNRLPNGDGPGAGLSDSDDIDGLGASIAALAQRLALRFERERMLTEVSEKIVQGLYLEEVLDFIYQSFHALIPYERMGCALLEKAGEWLRAYWERSDAPNIRLRSGFAARMEGSSLQSILVSGQPRIINDLELYLDQNPHSVATRLIVDEGMCSSLTCPLIAMGRPVGFLFFSSRRKNCYQSIHQDIFLRLAGLVSVVVERSRLYQELVQLNRELTEARDALKVQATHDALTGVWNRGAITEVLGKSFNRACREGAALSLILADIDHFKQVNDTYGHHVGDAVIRSVADRIGEAARSGDYVGRYGGEEFLVVLNNCDASGAAAVAERIRQLVRVEPVQHEEVRLRVTLSVGVAALRAGNAELTPDDLVKLADDALYAAKRQGRDRVVMAAWPPVPNASGAVTPPGRDPG